MKFSLQCIRERPYSFARIILDQPSSLRPLRPLRLCASAFLTMPSTVSKWFGYGSAVLRPCLILLLMVCGALGAEKSDADKAPPKLEPIQIGAPQRIEVLPAAIKLETPLRKVQVVVSAFYTDGRVQDLTRGAECTLGLGGIARIADALVTPLADGKTELTVRVGGLEQRIPIEVTGQGTPEKISFQYGTLAALSKNGCNAGGCHGAPSGKGGFAMSMIGFDPEADARLFKSADQYAGAGVEPPPAQADDASGPSRRAETSERG
jgi:hypothetical protein